MRVLILSVSDKRHMSMVAPYEEYFKKKNISYDIVRINRYVPTSDTIHYVDSFSNEIFEYPFVQTTNSRKITKIVPFMRFRRFAKKIIKERSYEFIVVWNENTAVLFGDLLLSKKNDYCVNIRDFLEIPFAGYALKEVMGNALFCTNPSPAPIYPNCKNMFTLYNRDTKVLENVKKKEKFKKKGDPLNIVFMGLYGSAPNTFKTIVSLLGRDSRYRLFFAGDGFDTFLKDYAKEIGAENVFTEGAFPYEKTYYYLSKADIINSYYNNFNTNPNLRFVSGVKQSYSPLLYIPAINDDNTTWATISKQYGFSYLINDANLQNLGDDLYNWYFSLDFSKFQKGCDDFNMVVEKARNQLFDIMDKKFFSYNSDK